MRKLANTAALGFAIVAATTSLVAAQASNNAAAANFVAADANADKVLTIDEFTRFIDLNAEDGIGNARQIQRAGRYQTAFNRVDTNGDGTISSAEIAAMANQ